MKVVFFNRFFFPNESATSQMASDLAFRLADLGWEVHAVCTYAEARETRHESVRGVTIHRVSASEHDRSLTAKALAYARFYHGARRQAFRLLRPGDIAVVKTDPPMLGPVLGRSVRAEGVRVVNWLQDLFPEIAAEYGIPGARTPVIRRIRDRWLQNSTCNVAISESMRQKLTSLRGHTTNLVVIHNWAKGNEIAPCPSEGVPLRQDWNLANRFIIGYSGNLGRVHEFRTLLNAAATLQVHSDIAFLIIGSGPQMRSVKQEAETLGLKNVFFQPPQPRELLSQTLGMCDIHIAILQPRFEGYVVPSKVYGILAAGRPCIYIGSRDSDTAANLQDKQAGIAVASGDDAALTAAVLSLRSDAVFREAMGRNARALFDERYEFGVASTKWEELLNRVSAAHC